MLQIRGAEVSKGYWIHVPPQRTCPRHEGMGLKVNSVPPSNSTKAHLFAIKNAAPPHAPLLCVSGAKLAAKPSWRNWIREISYFAPVGFLCTTSSRRLIHAAPPPSHNTPLRGCVLLASLLRPLSSGHLTPLRRIAMFCFTRSTARLMIKPILRNGRRPELE